MAEGMRRPQEILPNPDPSLITTEMIDRAITSLEARISARIDGIDAKYSARLDGIDKATSSFHDDLVRVPTLLDRSITSLRELLQTRLVCMEDDIQKIHQSLNERGSLIKEQITHLHDLIISKINELGSVTTERFRGVDSQFAERDTRTDQRAGDTKLAVDAAFAAAKEATGKIEAGFTKQIDAMSEMIDTKTKNADDKINDLKVRLTTVESRGAIMDPSISAGISSAMTRLGAIEAAQNMTGGRTAQAKDNTAMIIAIVGLIAAVAAVFATLFIKGA